MVVIKDKNIQQTTPTAVTIGNFDGVHLGHQKLIRNITTYCEAHAGVQSVVFSFNPHPRAVFTGEILPHVLTRKEKMSVIEKMNVDVYIGYPFDLEFANKPATEFLEDILLNQLNCTYLTVGENYRFGRKGEGDITLLKQFCEAHGITVQIEKMIVLADGITVSSTNIRSAIEYGDISRVNKMLGYEFFSEGVVQYGKQIGHTIGFPTANLSHGTYKVIPKMGVYVTHTEVQGKQYLSVTNVGDNPTVNGEGITIETHIMDFDDDIYNKEIKVNFLCKIRDQIKFSSLDELKKQIDMDAFFACEYEETFGAE